MALIFGPFSSSYFLLVVLTCSLTSFFSANASPVSPTESSQFVTANPSCNHTGYCRLPDRTTRVDDWSELAISNAHNCSSFSPVLLGGYTQAQFQAAHLTSLDFVHFEHFHYTVAGSLTRMPGYGPAQNSLFTTTTPCYYDQHRLPPVYYNYKCTNQLWVGCFQAHGPGFSCREITRTQYALRRLKPPTDCDSTQSCLRSDGVEMGSRCCQWKWAEERLSTGVACVKDIPSK